MGPSLHCVCVCACLHGEMCVETSVEEVRWFGWWCPHCLGGWWGGPMLEVCLGGWCSHQLVALRGGLCVEASLVERGWGALLLRLHGRCWVRAP